MLARFARLVPPLALTTLLPLALLAQHREEVAPRREAVLARVESPPSVGFEVAQEAPRAVPLEPVVLSPPKALRDAERLRLEEQAAAALARCEAMMAEVRAQAAIFEQRQPRFYLPDQLRRMLEQDFADIVARRDWNSRTSTAEELVKILTDVAEWLERTGRCRGRADVEAVRRTVTDESIRAVADRLPSWNLALALAPEPSVGYACGPGGCTPLLGLPIVDIVLGTAVVVRTENVRADDPRLDLARRARAEALERRARELTELLALPAPAR